MMWWRNRETASLLALFAATGLIDLADACARAPIEAIHWPELQHELESVLVVLLPLLAYVVGAVLVYWRGPKAALIAGVAGLVALEVMALFFVGPLEWLVTGVLARNIWTVGALTFAANVMGDPPTPRRFAALSAFVLARAALGPMCFVSAMEVTFHIHRWELVNPLSLGALASFLTILPLAGLLVFDGRNRVEAPRQALYRAPAEREPAPTPTPKPSSWRLLVPLLALVVCVGSLGVSDQHRDPFELWLIPLAGIPALYYGVGAVWRRSRSPLILLGAVVVFVGLPARELLPIPNSVDMSGGFRALAMVPAAIGLAYAALAVRGRTAGFSIALWMAVSTLGAIFVGAALKAIVESFARDTILPDVIAFAVFGAISVLGVVFLWGVRTTQARFEA